MLWNAAITIWTVGDFDEATELFIAYVYVVHLYIFSLTCHLNSTLRFVLCTLGGLCCELLL